MRIAGTESGADPRLRVITGDYDYVAGSRLRLSASRPTSLQRGSCPRLNLFFGLTSVYRPRFLLRFLHASTSFQHLSRIRPTDKADPRQRKLQLRSHAPPWMTPHRNIRLEITHLLCPPVPFLRPLGPFRLRHTYRIPGSLLLNLCRISAEGRVEFLREVSRDEAP